MKTRAQELGEAIALDRANSKFSQEDVAKAVGVTQQAFSGWEAGTSVPRLQRLDKLAEFFGPNSHTAMIAEHTIPKGFGSRATAGNVTFMSTEEHSATREYAEAAEGKHIQRHAGNMRNARAHPSMGTMTAEAKQSGPPVSSDETTVHVEQSRAAYGISSFEERSNPSLDMRDALARAASGVQLARQVLDDAADQIARAIANLPRI